MNEKKALFIAYLYPPVGGKGLPGVQRTVKFVRYLSHIKKYILTLETDLYPNFFPANNNLPLPINNEEVIRLGTVDIFKALLNVRKYLTSLFKKSSSPDMGAMFKTSEVSKTSEVFADKNSLFANIKDFVSGVITFPDYANPWIVPALWRGIKTVKENNIDVVFATGMPWSSLIIGWLLKVFTDVKLIIDFRDPWVNNPYAFDKGKLRKAAEKYLERRIVRSADIISLNTEELRKDFIRRYPLLPEDKFIVLVNGYDVGDFKNVSSEESEEDYNSVVLTHAGFLYGLRDPKPILQAMGKIRERNAQAIEKIKFRQMGDTELNYDLEGFVNENSLYENYDDLGPLSYNECLQNMSEADILVIIQQDTKTQIPSKIYEYIYLNKPILTISSRDGALGKMIEKYEFGDIFEPHDIEGLAEYLAQKVSDKEKSGTLKVNYKHRQAFDVRNIATQLEKIIENICT